MRALPARLLVALLLAGCTTTPLPERPATPEPFRNIYTQERDSAPAERPAIDYAALPDPVPAPEPRSRYGNKSPYEVLGKTYEVLPEARGYRESGLASWYGAKFHGHRTSSFEPFDMHALTAAHRSLPLPTWVRVTNLDNGRSTVVRVNDRGPFHSDRIIDLSWAAANKLGFADKGTARVEVVALEAADPDSATAGGERWHLQAGAFGLPDAARALAERIGAATGVAAQVQAGNETPYPLHRVRLGPFNSRTDADAMRRTLAEAGFETVVVAP